MQLYERRGVWNHGQALHISTRKIAILPTEIPMYKCSFNFSWEEICPVQDKDFPGSNPEDLPCEKVWSGREQQLLRTG